MCKKRQPPQSLMRVTGKMDGKLIKGTAFLKNNG